MNAARMRPALLVTLISSALWLASCGRAARSPLSDAELDRAVMAVLPAGSNRIDRDHDEWSGTFVRSRRRYEIPVGSDGPRLTLAAMGAVEDVILADDAIPMVAFPRRHVGFTQNAMATCVLEGDQRCVVIDTVLMCGLSPTEVGSSSILIDISDIRR